MEVLHNSLTILTSLEKYLKELASGQLIPGPIHSEKFWRENARFFENDQFLNVRKLVDLLDSASI